MARCVIGYGDLVSAGTVTASSEASAALTAANLQDPRVSARPWRAAANSASIVLDAGSATSAGALALGGCNLTPNGTRRVRLSLGDSSGAAGDAYDSGPGVPGPELGYPCGVRDRTQLVHILPADVTFRYARLDLTDAQPPQAGRLWVLPTFRPAYNFDFKPQDVRKPYSEFRTAQDGTGYGEKRPIQHGYKVLLPHITEDEKDLYFDPLLEASDILYDVMFCKDPAAANVASRTIIGNLEALPAIENLFYRWWTAELTIWERM